MEIESSMVEIDLIKEGGNLPEEIKKNIEKYLIENGKNVICIDPSKSKINPYTDEKRVKEPDYKNVKEYLDKNEYLLKEAIVNKTLFCESGINKYIAYG